MIYGHRIRLRAVERNDLAKFHEWLNDQDVTDHISTHLPLSMMDEEQWLDRMSRLDQEEKPLAIDIKQGDAWRLIGNSGFFNFEWTNRSAEFGLFIGDKSFWSKGLGTETVQLLLRHGFQTLNLYRIYLRVYSTNPRAMRAYEKAGFTLEGTMRDAVYRHGKYADVHIMSVLRSEWDAAAEGK